MSKRKGHTSQPVYLDVSDTPGKPLIVPFNRKARRIWAKTHGQIGLSKPLNLPLKADYTTDPVSYTRESTYRR